MKAGISGRPHGISTRSRSPLGSSAPGSTRRRRRFPTGGWCPRHGASWSATSIKAASPKARGGPTCSRPGTRRSSAIPAGMPICAARRAISSSMTRRRMPTGPAKAALPLPAECHDADPAHHQRLRLSWPARAVSTPAKDDTHRLHRRLDYRQQPFLPGPLPRIHWQRAQPVGRPAQAPSSSSRCSTPAARASPRPTTSPSCARRCCRSNPTSSSTTKAPTSFR